jgi:hypothetical protein
MVPGEGVHHGKSLEAIVWKVMNHALAFAGLAFEICATQKQCPEVVTEREVLTKAHVGREWIVATATPGAVPVRSPKTPM